MRLVTIATLASLPQARALAASIERHEPSWPLEVLLVGRGDVVADAGDPGPLRLRSLAEALGMDTRRMIARHDEPELRTLLVPRVLSRYARAAPGPVLHLPPSAWVLGGLEPVAAAIAARGLALAPRLLEELPQDGLQPAAEDLERAGRVSEAIIGVDGREEALEFLQWWSERTERALGSLDGRGTPDRPEDRHWLARFLELAPARFGAAVLEDPGFNLSMWNLHEHRLGEAPGGGAVVVDGEEPLRLLDLPGFEPDRPHRLSALATRVRVSRSPALRELLVRYADELKAAGWSDVERRREIGRRLEDGAAQELVYDDALRALYARALALGERFGDLFSGGGSRAFLEWLAGPAPEGGAHGITRYVFFRVARERPDVMRAYPDLDGEDGREYVRWCRAFGSRELSIPERFMPPPEDGGASMPVPLRASGGEAGAARSRTRPAASELAVRVTGYLGHTLGLGAAARGYVRALGAAGVPVSTASVALEHLAVPVQMQDGYGRHVFEERRHESGHGFEIVAVNADELPGFVERLGDSYFEGPRIGIWGWETNSIPRRWRAAFELVDEIWVYSRFMAENIGAVAPVPVIALPPPVQAPSAPAAPLRLGVGEGFLFLFVFDYLSTIQRKNPVGLIEAFRSAFSPGEGPQLLIKTINAPLRPLADEEVRWAAHGREDIHVVDRSLSGEELNGVMAACDCYVSLHRAEGFGLTMAEAMAIGKPVIGTGYSGNVDFMNERNSYLVEHTITRVGPECEIYPPEGEWAQPSLEHAAALMREVHEQPERAAAVGARAREDVARVLSAKATGAAMRGRLEQLLAGAAAAAA